MKGYSLFELIIIMGIMLLLIGGGIAGYREYSRRQSLNNASRQLEGDLRLAQEMALSGKKPALNCIVLDGIEFTPSGNAYSIDANCDTSGNPIPIGKDGVNLPSGITMTANPNTSVVFRVLGLGTYLPSGTNLVLTLSLAGSTETRTITVTSTGEIRTQ